MNFFSVRNHNDKSYGKGREVDKGIYDIDGFQIRFFTDKEIQDLTSEEGFEILWIKERIWRTSYTLSCIEQEKKITAVCKLVMLVQYAVQQTQTILLKNGYISNGEVWGGICFLWILWPSNFDGG